MAPRTIPIIDFSQDPNVVAEQVLAACSTIGFFYMVNHGLPQDQVDRAFALVSFIAPSYSVLTVFTP
jgi:isopenicillin N synthase-like dioxygenase